VFDVEAVLSIPPIKIEKIDVINKTHYLGDNILRSIIMMNTKAGDFAGYPFSDGSNFFEFQTLTPHRKFQRPNYETTLEKNRRIADFSTTLFWQPALSISQGDTTLRFYTSDNVGVYDVFIRGVNESGEQCFGKGSITIE